MNNTALKSQIWITVKEFAQLKGVSDRAVRKNIEKFTARLVDGNGGKQYEILLSSVESELQEKFLNQNTHTLIEQGVSQIMPIDKMLPAPFSLRIKNSFEKTVIPIKAKEIGLARFDLLKAWEDFRNKSNKKTQADKDFIALYNLGSFYIDIYRTLGKISAGTLYRWQKDLKEANGDYIGLVPQYNYRSDFEKETKLSEIERKYFLDLLLQPSKISVGNAVRLIKFVLEKQGVYEICSYSTYKRFADWFKSKHYDTWVLMREGQKALIDKVAPYIERDVSKLQVGDVLVADGHTLDFFVINPFNGKPCRATLVGYLDWASNALVGYEIMLSENTQCIASALRNSIIKLGKIPKICYQDNGRAFRSKFFEGSKNFDESGFNGLFGKLGIVPVFAQPYNAKAKLIERFFREFSETCERLLPSYCGNSVSNKPAYMMRNEKFHTEIHSKFVPTIEQAVKLIDAWMEFHYAQTCPHNPEKTIGQVFNEGRGEGVDLDLLDDLMMAEEIRKIGRNGVKFLNNHYHSSQLYGIKEQVVIKYSLFDLSYVKVYNQKGEYIAKADTVLKIHPMAVHMGDSTDVNSLKMAIKKSKKLQSETIKTARKLLPKTDKELLEWQKDVIDVQSTPVIKNKSSKIIENKEDDYDLMKCFENVVTLNSKDDDLDEYSWFKEAE